MSLPIIGGPRPKVLIPEKVSPDGLALLKQTLDIDERKGLTPEELIAIIPEYDALIVRSETKVTAELLKAAKKLKVVARAGVGVDNVDVSAATKLGVIVVNSPAGNINAAAEHTIACQYMLRKKEAEMLTDCSNDVGREECRGRMLEPQKRQMGTKSIYRYRTEGQDIRHYRCWKG